VRLTLHYRGALRANGSPLHKHELRQKFHSQLATLWKQRPMSEHESFLKPRRRDGEYSLLRDRAPFTFVPLVAAEMDAIAEITIVLLRPEPPGGLLTQGGDIDNRLKTLFDALSMPQQSNSLPPSCLPTADETPFFYCLLENDNLVTSISVRTEQLLEPGVDSALVDAAIHVRTRVTRPTMGNGALG
jgi:hypothetical protein